MFFVLRCLFWLGLVFIVAPILFPGSKSHVPQIPTVSTESVSASAPAQAAAEGIAGLSAADVVAGAGKVASFCDSSAGVCEGAIGALNKFGDAIGQGIDMIAGHGADGSRSGQASGDATALDPGLRGTLTAADRAEPWHGKPKKADRTEPQG
ncbi:hypothetical protein [Segnochrobactrum spirostomi]|uniref:Uncharacterized protein n=1 Tax=Segnochrobactrum spirostomi TaxID=2608987 RepID=A0A6A7Y0R3_9HYPH|nr:hypothetical protein [Segnochrobactrum spirostomi]MQT12335.1 hypothetical protein [Segnochrobactrum spirostomi]